jgi:hypothetical protein
MARQGSKKIKDKKQWPSTMGMTVLFLDRNK